MNQELCRQLQALKAEHRALDAAISTHYDQLRVTRMKKRKLVLKDAIAKIESQMIPDLMPDGSVKLPPF